MTLTILLFTGDFILPFFNVFAVVSPVLVASNCRLLQRLASLMGFYSEISGGATLWLKG